MSNTHEYCDRWIKEIDDGVDQEDLEIRRDSYKAHFFHFPHFVDSSSHDISKATERIENSFDMLFIAKKR